MMKLCAGCRLASGDPANPLSQTCGSSVTISPTSRVLDSFWKIQVSSVLLPEVSWGHSAYNSDSTVHRLAELKQALRAFFIFLLRELYFW